MSQSLAAEFYDTVALVMRRNPAQRHSRLLDLHRLSAADAARIAPRDGRTAALIVAHCAEWDRAETIALGEVLAGVRWPRVMSNHYTVTPQGEPLEFGDVDAFNAYFARTYDGRDWPAIRDAAVGAAATLFQLFDAPGLLTAERLDATDPHPFTLANGQEFDLPCGHDGARGHRARSRAWFVACCVYLHSGPTRCTIACLTSSLQQEDFS